MSPKRVFLFAIAISCSVTIFCIFSHAPASSTRFAADSIPRVALADGFPIVTASSWPSSIPAPVIFVTLARTPAPVFETQNQSIRDYEYFLGLSYAFSKGFRIAGVVSESDDKRWQLADAWPWDIQLYRSATSFRSKSQKETACVRALVEEVATRMSPPISNDTWIIKLSGRYQVVRDSLLSAMLQHSDAHLIARADSSEAQIFTFFYAMKWQFLREFFSTIDVAVLKSNNIEKVILEWARARQLVIRFIPLLYVVANINAGGTGFF
jgi:hypothetical protein